MNNLTLQQMEKLGISKWMNEKERNKAIEKALEEQKELIANDSHKDVFEALRTTDEILVQGGLFTYILNKKKFKLNVLTKEDMNLLDNIDNLNEEGVIYDIQLPFKFHIRNSHDNYVTLKAQNYIEAQEVFDNLFGKGVYKASAIKL